MVLDIKTKFTYSAVRQSSMILEWEYVYEQQMYKMLTEVHLTVSKTSASWKVNLMLNQRKLSGGLVMVNSNLKEFNNLT